MKPGDLVAGRYQLQEQVGAGSMGVVWRSLDTELDRVVALKSSHAQAASPEDDKRVRREARAAAGVHHPGVVTLFDIVREGADRWLVMEYMPAESLAQVLAERGPLPPAEVARIGAELAGALAAVHAAGVVHRDVKPGNVLVGADGRVKLTDFGISRGTWSEATLTASAMIVGTPAYISPEVAGGDSPTAASDVFALGATLFAAVEGTAPYGRSDNPLALLRRAVAGKVTPAQRAGTLAPALDALLAGEPADRPTAAAAQLMLERIAAGTLELDPPATPARPAPAIPAAAPPAPGPPGPPGRARRAPAVAVIAVVALVGLAAGTFAVTRDEDGPDRSTLAGAREASLVGEPRTADPCSLLDAARLAEFGEPSLLVAAGSFESCNIELAAPAGARIDVQARLLSDAEPTPEGEEMTSGQFSAVQASEPASCGRTLLLPGGERVAIEAAPVGGGAEIDYCAVAAAGADGAAAVLARGPMPRRAGSFPAQSLARSRACGLLGAAAIGDVGGLRGADPQAGFGEWSCGWAAGGTSVGVAFDRDPPPGADAGERRSLSGLATYVQAEGAGACRARIVNRRYEVDGNPTAEIADLLLRGPGSAKRMCADVAALAAVAAARLPAATDASAGDGGGKGGKGEGKGRKKPGGGGAPTSAERAARCAEIAVRDPIRAAECAAGAAS